MWRQHRIQSWDHDDDEDNEDNEDGGGGDDDDDDDDQDGGSGGDDDDDDEEEEEEKNETRGYLENGGSNQIFQGGYLDLQVTSLSLSQPLEEVPDAQD